MEGNIKHIAYIYKKDMYPFSDWNSYFQLEHVYMLNFDVEHNTCLIMESIVFA